MPAVISMNNAQFELLLDNLYKCSIAISNAIEVDDSDEMLSLIQKKREILQLLNKNLKYIEHRETSLYKLLVNKIKEQENLNIKALKAKHNELYKEYANTNRKSKLYAKYALKNNQIGKIVDVTK